MNKNKDGARRFNRHGNMFLNITQRNSLQVSLNLTFQVQGNKDYRILLCLHTSTKSFD